MAKAAFIYIIFICICSVLSLFEDQIGKFDWDINLLGNVQHGLFDATGSKLAVGTEKNVFSLIDVKTGSTKIRHVLEPGLKGHVQFIHAFENRALVVVGSCATYTVREFGLEKGLLLKEKHYSSLLGGQECQWSAQGEDLLRLQKLDDGRLHLTIISGKDGSKQEVVSDEPKKNSRCAASSLAIVCIDTTDGSLTSLSLTDLSVLHTDSVLNLGFNSDDLEDLMPITIPTLLDVAIATDEKLVVVGPEGNRVLSVGRKGCVWGGTISEGIHFLLVACEQRQDVRLTLIDLTSGERVMEGTFASEVSPVNIYPYMTRNPNGEIVNCRYLVTFEDHSLRFATVKGEPWWSREEALASIVSVQMVDLPVSEREAIIEEEFDSPQDGLLSRMAKRITSESYQIFLIFKEVLLGRKTTPSAGVVDRGLVRDKFGFHKMIVVATEANKIFGIDSLSGNVAWSRFVPNFSPLIKQIGEKDSKEYPLYILRGSAHHPLTAQVALIGKNKATGKSSIFVFNPITGTPYPESPVDLSYKVSLVHQLANFEGDTQFIKPLLFLDEEARPWIYPDVGDRIGLTKPLYLAVASSSDCSLTGFKVHHSQEEGFSSTLVWTLPICSSEFEIITSVAGKRAEENVHSQGRPLADRSVLYKYLNPNLLAVVVEGKHSVNKAQVRVSLVDSVTGNVVFTTSHKRATGPVHLVHSENWLVYSFYNEKLRRTEVVSVELYEGKERSSELVVTSFDNIKPMVEKQAFIFPSNIVAMKETITQLGLTNKHILVAVPTRGILELPRSFLDPRRPTVPSNEAREEGLIPYVPELPIPPEGIINYNKTIALPSGIHTTPAGLESTCLVFVYGLDLFFTRVMPSKTFDVLKDDFDHWLISTVLIGLISASVVSRRLAAKKALRQAWK